MTYPVAALETFVRHDALDIQLKFEGLAMPQATATTQGQTSLRGRALQVAVINTPIFGGQRELAIPGSTFDDRLLDIVVIEQMDVGTLGTSIAQFFGPKEHTGLSLPTGKKRTSRHHPAELTGVPGIHHVQARGVMITTSADPQDATLDGEVLGQTPMYVYVADQPLRVRMPDQAGTSS
jgi:diacylglycerol kinase family enzyme